MEAWKLVKKETVFKKYITHLERRDYQLPSGEVADFYIKTGPPGACVLALTEDNKVITVRQYRPGPNKVLHELPGGFVDENEEVAVAAARELREETGYSGDVRLVCQYFEDAYTDRIRYGCVATGCKKVDVQHLEDREFMEVVLMELPDFIKMVRAGQMTDVAAALLGLDHLGLLNG